MKLTNKRVYLDFNATTPLADSVCEWLAKGDLFLANPSSAHSSGKNARKLIADCEEFLFHLFQLEKKDYHLMFHSGATEAVNTFIRGKAEKLEQTSDGKKLHLFCSSVDHACALKTGEWIKMKGHHLHVFEVDQLGQFDLQDLIKKIKACSGPVLLNYLWVNNELGTVWPLKWASEIKQQTDAWVHVDAAQAIGKVADCFKLDPTLDCYTFSGHKFGAMKGIGASLIKKDFTFIPLLLGGSQQQGLRAGTENPQSIHSFKLALNELMSRFDYQKCLNAKQIFEQKLKNLLADKGEILALANPLRNATTISFFIEGKSSDTLLIAFDLAGIDVSAGPACSSGQVAPNRVMQSLGYTKEQAKGAIRISFSPYLTQDQAEKIWDKVEACLKNHL